VLVALVAGWLWWAGLFGPRPDDAAIAAALRPRLPPFMQLASANVVASERVGGQQRPTFKVRFFAKAVLTTTVYLRADASRGATRPEPRLEGTLLPLSGEAVMRYVDGVWLATVTMNEPPLFTAVPAPSLGPVASAPALNQH
jgi:hypothetical protein